MIEAHERYRDANVLFFEKYQSLYSTAGAMSSVADVGGASWNRVFSCYDEKDLPLTQLRWKVSSCNASDRKAIRDSVLTLTK